LLENPSNYPIEKKGEPGREGTGNRIRLKGTERCAVGGGKWGRVGGYGGNRVRRGKMERKGVQQKPKRTEEPNPIILK